MQEHATVASSSWTSSEPHGERVGKTPATSRLTPFIAREASGAPATAGAEAAVSNAAAGGGAPLPDDVRLDFESCLNTDLSGVRVHTGGASAEAASAVGARAYATGQDIHFAAGQYDPQSAGGKHLLAHEVAHTVQQAGGNAARPQYKLAVSTPGDAGEREADRAADAMTSGLSFAIGYAPPAPTLARTAEPSAEEPAPEAGAPEADAAPADGEPEADAAPITLDDALGPDYQDERDADFEGYLDARDGIELLLGAIRSRDSSGADRITTELGKGQALVDEIGKWEDIIVDTATRDESGEVTVDQGAVTDLESTRDDLLDYTELHLAEGKLWGLIIAVPFLEGLEQKLKGWIAILEDIDARFKIAMASYDRIKKIFDKYKDEFEEACNKMKVDAATVVADLAILGLLGGPYGVAAGLIVTLVGLAAGYDIDYGEETPLLSKFNFVLGSADYARQGAEWASGNPGVVVSKGFSEGLAGLGTAIDVVSLLKDSSEAAQHKAMLDEIWGELQGWKAENEALAKAWPSAKACLDGSVQCLNGLQTALAAALPAIEAAQADVTTLRAQIGK